MALIKFKRAERQSRESLSKDEILAFLERIKGSKYDNFRQFAYILYFFGLRPCEIDEETRREGDSLITRNRKRKNGKIEYKKIPIPTQAEDLIDWEKPLTIFSQTYSLSKSNPARIAKAFPKTVYSLPPMIIEYKPSSSLKKFLRAFFTFFE